MSIFGTDSKKKEKQATAPHARRIRRTRQHKPAGGAEHDIVRAPWLSEKALIQTEKGVYAFAVPKRATKADVAGAIKAVYNVDPKKVRIVNLPGKTKPMRNQRGEGQRASRRKAYVYLKAGDTIQFA